ncbi:molecular chaperone [Deinococcus sp. YIM 77859]|uniref:fimbrial biogenesis chaperone n=1 Tax=Deinococcus sp. YIM 77859 TaxID=1540221 RepID=UPI00054D539C|nr:molecular chaperone [Deinococcus sp. YIM 77859]
MRFILPSLPALLRLSLLGVVLPSAQAATSLSFAPISLKLEGNQRSTQLTVRNTSHQPASFRMELASWTQDGEDKLAPTRDVIVNPATFRLAPGQEQTIRFALRGAPSNTEKAYRVFVQELPSTPAQAQEANSIQLTTLYRLSLPLMVFPKNAAAQPQFALERSGTGTFVVARNTGNRYATLTDLELSAGGQKTKVPAFNLLGGGSLRFPVPGNAAEVGLSFTQGGQLRQLTLRANP